MVKKATENAMMELVPLREVAGVLGTSPEVVLGLADRAGAKVVERWNGDLCIDGATARSLREGQAAEQRRENELQAEHRAYVADRAVRRRTIVHEAYEVARKGAFAAQVEIGRQINSGEIQSEYATGGGAFPISPSLDPQGESAARHVGTEAGAEFDAKEPELGFYEWKESR